MTRGNDLHLPNQTAVVHDRQSPSPTMPECKRQTARYRVHECRECHDDRVGCDGKRGPGPLHKCSRCTTLDFKCLPPRLEDYEDYCITCNMGFVPLHDSEFQLQCQRCIQMDSSHHDQPPAGVDIESYAKPFISFISENPTVFHAVSTVGKRLESYGFTKLSERDSWTMKLSKGGKYFFERNGSSVIAFVVGENYEPGNGASIIASHIDALTTRLKPIPTLSTKAGFVQLGVAPYAGALNNTWWDRDLGIGGRVLVKNSETGKIESKLVKLGWPIARIPTLAPHFGAAADVSNPNKETEMVPIIGLESTDSDGESDDDRRSSILGGAGTFTATQPERLVKAIAGEMNIQDCKYICNLVSNATATKIPQTARSSTGNSNSSTPNPPNSAVSRKNSSLLAA